MSIYRFLMRVHYVLTMPVSVFFIVTSLRIHPAYRMGLLKRLWLGVRMFVNTIRVRTGTSYKSHLVMAMKILETPPEVKGDVVECGTWKGGSAVNLSLVCRITGRQLHIYDSFEGLPAGEPGDREAHVYQPGDYCGTLEEVKRNIARCGAPECCVYVKGWFKDTLPQMSSPVLLAFLDVDLEASLHVCVRYLWPHLVEKGYIFIDECVGVDYCALFFSETYWQRYFNRTPPGLIGAGTGLALGEYYFGPWADRGAYPLQHANAGCYTRKDLSGHWTYYPEEG